MRPTHTTVATVNFIVAGSRPIASHAARTWSQPSRKYDTGANGMLNSAAKRAASRGVRLVPQPPITIGGPGCCTGFGSAGESTTEWCFPANEYLLADGRLPEAGDDLELLLEHREAVTGRGERDAVRGVLGVVPTGAEPELDAAAAHRVGLRDLDRERAREAERHRRDERAEPDAGGLASDRREGHPRVGRTRSGCALADALVVVGAEEGVEAEPLGRCATASSWS